ncbi:histidine phosphatase family protein [Ruminococcus sp.]|uniref:histidine phosphatase family protein n=1 Tax=Ruminococcus sp. TaxID=41978 RepID=UPI0025F46041|nr:histidine phosphatase family protein [Ruminococcus sp.]MCR4640013.1 histidine phosphatase family protein [Ruminococcus sp.]
MKIFSTRHGQTSYNKQEIILGTTDIELDETGEKQALELADRIAGMNCIDIIIASPMKRAQQTARAVAERCGLEIFTEERLREWDYGYYEGKSRFIDGFAENKTEFGVRMGKSGESLLQLAHRVYSALDDIIRVHSGRNVLIVSHGGVCRVIETYFSDMTTEQFSNWFMDNCGLIEYSID